MIANAPGLLVALAAACLSAAPAPDEDLTPGLVEAIQNGNLERVRRLLRDGVPATSVSADGETPLCAALRAGLTDVATELLQHGADATAQGSDHQSPLVLASLRRSPELMRRLLETGANPNTSIAEPVSKQMLDSIPDESLRNLLKRERRLTPLMLCTYRGDVEAVTLLLKAGASRDSRTAPNRLDALDFAAEKDFVFVMRILLGRDPEEEPKVIVHVSLSNQKAVLQMEGETKLETKVSTGRSGFTTPAGRYVVTHKYKEWKSTIYKVPMPFFMRLNSGNFGLHSGYVTGSPASHGCIRLPDAMARKFFDIITVGDEVIIEP